MAASRAKLLAHRKKKLDTAPTSVKLLQPMGDMSMEEPSKIKEKIRVPLRKSALVAGEGRNMGMDID